MKLLSSGHVTFVLDIDGRHKSARLSNIGEYVIVPKSVWHTAKTKVNTKMLIIAPGEGTQNRKI